MGAEAGLSSKNVAERSDAIIPMVPDSPDVEAVYLTEEERLKDRERETHARVQNLAYIVLFLMAVVALLVLGADVSNYIASIKSVSGLGLEIVDLEVIDDDNPRALVRFRVRNDSPLETKLERCLLELYLNEERIGSSYSMYMGTDPNLDPKTHLATQNINQSLAPGQTLVLEFTLYIYSAQMEIVRHAQTAESMTWHATANLTTFLPYSREKNFVVRLQAEFEE